MISLWTFICILLQLIIFQNIPAVGVSHVSAFVSLLVIAQRDSDGVDKVQQSWL